MLQQLLASLHLYRTRQNIIQSCIFLPDLHISVQYVKAFPNAQLSIQIVSGSIPPDRRSLFFNRQGKLPPGLFALVCPKRVPLLFYHCLKLLKHFCKSAPAPGRSSRCDRIHMLFIIRIFFPAALASTFRILPDSLRFGFLCRLHVLAGFCSFCDRVVGRLLTVSVKLFFIRCAWAPETVTDVGVEVAAASCDGIGVRDMAGRTWQPVTVMFCPAAGAPAAVDCRIVFFDSQ